MSVSIGDPSVVLNPNAPRPDAASQGEQIARAAADAAKRVAGEKARFAQQTMRTAATANQRYLKADGALRAKVALLQEKGSSLPPEERAALESQVSADRDNLAQLKEEANKANGQAGEARHEARAADEKRVDVETTANRVLKALGKGEPFGAQRTTEDAFVAELVSIKLARLLGNPKLPNPRQAATQDARRMAAALRAGLSNGAEVLEQQVEGNSDPLYRKGLLEDIKGHLGFLGHELAGGSEDVTALFEDEAARQALASLARTAEMLGPEGAQRMAEAFVKGALYQRGTLKDPSILGLRLQDALASGQSGATFALEVALAFDQAGDKGASEAALSALCQAMREARERFDQAARRGDGLDAELGKYLGQPEAWVDLNALLNGILGFEDSHLPDYVQYEQSAAALAAMMAGAARVLAAGREGRLPRTELSSQLTQESLMALGRMDRLSTSAAGQQRFTEALDAQGRGERTFLDELPEVAQAQLQPGLRVVGSDRFESNGSDFLQGVGLGMAQQLAPQMLALKTGARLDELNRLLKTAVGQNPALFGLSPANAARVVVIFSGFIHSKRPNSIRENLVPFQKLGNTSLKALAAVMAGCCGTTSSYGHGAELLAALSESSKQLQLARGGLGIVTSMLKRPPATTSVTGLVALVGTGLLVNVGCVTPRVAESYSALVGGLAATPGFSADAEFLTGVGLMLSSISGSRLAETIALTALKARANAAPKATPKPADDVANLQAYLKKAA